MRIWQDCHRRFAAASRWDTRFDTCDQGWYRRSSWGMGYWWAWAVWRRWAWAWTEHSRQECFRTRRARAGTRTRKRNRYGDAYKTSQSKHHHSPEGLRCLRGCEQTASPG